MNYKPFMQPLGAFAGEASDATADPSELKAEMKALKRVIRRGNRRWKRLVLLEALGLAIAAPLAYLLMIFALDSFVFLSTFGRFLSSLVFLGAVVWQVRRLGLSWRRARFSDDQVALAMERNTPGGLENRLINSVQLAAHGALVPVPVRAALIRENFNILQRQHVEQAAQSRPAMIRVGLALLAITAGLAFRAWQPERFSIAATRILMPFANIAPLYRTQIQVEPGDIDASLGEDVRLLIRIEGRVPEKILVLSRAEGERTTEEIPVPPGQAQVEHVFTNLRGPMTYAIRGGDFVTPYYSIRVPVPSGLQRLRVRYVYPNYTGLPDRVQDSSSGDMQAVFGTETELRVFLNRPADSAVLVFAALNGENDAAPAGTPERLALTRENPTEFSGRLRLERSRRYRIETRQSGQDPSQGPAYEIQVMDDRPPDLHLQGIEDGAEVTLDVVAALTVTARDDFGLLEVGVFSRLRHAEDDAWTQLSAWTIDPPSAAFDQDWVLPVAGLGAAEGEIVEITARGRDNNPLRHGVWHTGERYALSIGGEASRLQVEYERILKLESDLRDLIQGTLDLSDAANQWMRQLDPGSELRWDDGDNLQKLKQGMTGMAEQQSSLRALAASVARDMPEAAGNLKLATGMLADTEMVRAIQMIERVPQRDNPQQKRAALGEARLTQERTIRSLRDILNAFVQYRRDWELENMLPFTRMLAQRQTGMAEESLGYRDLPGGVLTDRVRSGTARRQTKVKELTGLAGTAFEGLAQRGDVVGELMAAAFGEAAVSLGDSALHSTMAQAADRLALGEWQPAASHQHQAAEALQAVYQSLRETQAEVARQMMDLLRELTADSPDAQAAIQQLKPGFTEQLMHGDLNVMPDILQMIETAEALTDRQFEPKPDGAPSAEGVLADYISTHVSGSLMADEERDFSIMTLATSPGGQIELIPGFETSDTMEISVLQSYEDIVGALLEEADDIREEFESIVNLLLGQDIEAGDSGKGGHGMASVSAAAPTGNQKPDTHEHGGASRIGRQGARAHGIAVGDESINRRGRDEAQEGSQEIPDVDLPPIQETLSDDPAPDHATGVGGREVESELQSTFSVQDAGEWDDTMVDRMKEPQSAYQIVERAGAPLDAEVAEMLRAMDSQQEQLIERIKRVKKELDNLYLPTDHLDDAMRDLSVNLDRLREQPDPEAFRLQIESLDRLIGAVMVFDRPSSEFQPSLPRQAVVRGEILDEPLGPTLPGYEEAVKRYYERLAAP